MRRIIAAVIEGGNQKIDRGRPSQGRIIDPLETWIRRFPAVEWDLDENWLNEGQFRARDESEYSDYRTCRQASRTAFAENDKEGQRDSAELS